MYLDLFVSVSKHRYSFAATGLKVRSREFSTRQAALDHLYKICAKHGLVIKKIYDDKHFKTYICNDGIRFYIHRI